MNFKDCNLVSKSLSDFGRRLMRNLRPVNMIVAASVAVLFTQSANAHRVTDAFVSQHGDGTTGADWCHAFKDFSQIKWANLSNGSTIYVEGGIYNTPLVFNADGVTVRNGAAPHNGQVDLVGTSSSGPIGMDVGNRSGIQILATPQPKGSELAEGFRVRNYAVGFRVGPNASGIRLQGCGITENSTTGILTSGNLEFDRCVVHDNGTSFKINVIQSQSPGRDYGSYLVARENWIFNSNYSHTGAGIRIEGDENSAWQATFIQQCVLGPCLLRGAADWTPKDVLSINNSLFLDSEDANVMAASPQTMVRFCTIFSTPHNALGTGHNCLNVPPGTLVDNSIVYGGQVDVAAGVKLGTPNDQFNTTGNKTALSPTEHNPNFVADVDDFDGAVPAATLEAADFTARSSTAAGSSITSVGLIRYLILK
jgi:hypothetical protein